MSIVTFRHPLLSSLQSAVHQMVLGRAARKGAPGPGSLAASAGDPMMNAVDALGSQMLKQGGVPGRPPVGGDIVKECALLAYQYVEALWHGDLALAKEIWDSLRFSDCDLDWLEVIACYERFIHSGKTIPYIPLVPGTGVIQVNGVLNVALVADWGTGTPAALNVLAQAVALQPDVIIHLGDVYYAGTAKEEQQYFYDAVEGVLSRAGKRIGTGPGEVRVFTLAGNHDMYSGGIGYYSVIKQLGQPASYFCLRNDDWQIVCLDTGYNDRDPLTLLSNSNLTSLTSDQLVWLNALMADTGSRKTVFLSHHPLYSAAAPVGKSTVGSKKVRWGINPVLYSQLEHLLERVAVWLWGHEHNTVVFNPHARLPAGRCIGSGAVPVLVSSQPYKADRTLKGVGDIPVPTMDRNYRLSHDRVTYYHGFAMLQLSGASATVTYYQVPPNGTATKLGVPETFPTS